MRQSTCDLHSPTAVFSTELICFKKNSSTWCWIRFAYCPMDGWPNHLGMALQRHRRAGRLENRDQRWYLPASAQSEQ